MPDDVATTYWRPDSLVPRRYNPPRGNRSRPSPPSLRSGGPAITHVGYDRALNEWLELTVPRNARIADERQRAFLEIDSVMRTLPHDPWAEPFDPGTRVLRMQPSFGFSRKNQPTESHEPGDAEARDPRPDDPATRVPGSRDLNNAGLLVTEGDQTAHHRLWSGMGVEAVTRSAWLASGGWGIEDALPEIDVAVEIATRPHAEGGRTLKDEELRWIDAHPLKREQVARRERELITEVDDAIGASKTLLQAIRAGRRRTARQKVIVDRLAAFIVEHRPPMAALARHIGCNRDTLYQLKRRGEEMTVLARIDALEKHISEQLDAHHRTLLAAMGLDPVKWAEEATLDADLDAAA